MPRLSTYSNFDYPDGEERVFPWEFWTEEEKALVIRESYRDSSIFSPEVKAYLDSSRVHFWTQWLVPLTVTGLLLGPLRAPLFGKAFKKHRYIGYRNVAAVGGVFTIGWLNLSPFVFAKERQQLETLKLIFERAGYSMKMYNDMLPHSTTATSLDKDTWNLYVSRNSSSAGFSAPEEDSAPPFLPDTKATRRIKKIYQ